MPLRGPAAVLNNRTGSRDGAAARPRTPWCGNAAGFGLCVLLHCWHDCGTESDGKCSSPWFCLFVSPPKLCMHLSFCVEEAEAAHTCGVTLTSQREALRQCSCPRAGPAPVVPCLSPWPRFTTMRWQRRAIQRCALALWSCHRHLGMGMQP